MKNLASYIDHTILKADASMKEIDKVCDEALEHGFASVCVNPYYVRHVSGKLSGEVKTTSVIGFPLGANRSEVKALEASLAIEDGADELDMVMNICALKNKDYDIVQSDIMSVVNVSKGKAILKVIIETSLLNEEEKVKACQICRDCHVDFVKTSTGFSTGGATVADVALMKNIVGDGIGVKASGGVRDSETALKMIDAGATRIGASASVDIVSGSISKDEPESKY